jgi:hypothetical protein
MAREDDACREATPSIRKWIMRASEMIEELAKMIKSEGDLQLMYDCGSVLLDVELIKLLNGPHFDPAVIVVSSGGDVYVGS